MGFNPITVDGYVRSYLSVNPRSRAPEVIARLQAALAAYRSGRRCACGERIWVVGAVDAGLSCFTCITGEGDPSEDYEIAEACDKYDEEEP